MGCAGADPLVSASPLDPGRGDAVRVGPPKDLAPACGTTGAVIAIPAACPGPCCGPEGVPGCRRSVVCALPGSTPKRPATRCPAGGNAGPGAAVTAAGGSAPRCCGTGATGP